MKFILHGDGSFDIESDYMSLKGAYPEADGKRPGGKAVVSGNTVVYPDEDGTVTLRFCNENGLKLSWTVENYEKAHEISPFAGAEVKNFRKVFRQGFGVGGPSGFCGSDEDADSYGIAAFGNGEGCCVMHVRDHGKYNMHFAKRGCLLKAVFEAEETLKGVNGMPDIYFTEGQDWMIRMKEAASDIASFMKARKPEKPAFHWCSWYYLYHTLDTETLEEYTDGFVKYREYAPFSHVQIDAGYCKSLGDWLVPGPYFPEGMKKAADIIKSKGFEPAIWISPFMVGDRSSVYRNHKDWLLRDRDGKIIVKWERYNESKLFGYRDFEYYVLDTSNPEALDYITDCFRELRSYGYTMFKIDFMDWGMVDSSTVRRAVPGKTSFEYFRECLAAMRKGAGEDALFLGLSPFLPSIGYYDMMRIGSDAGAQWDGAYGPVNMLREIVADRYFDGIYWQNDPDTVILRNFHTYFRPEQIEALAIFQAVTGGVITTSDPVHELSEERRELLKLIRPGKKFPDVEISDWQEGSETKTVFAETGSGAVIFFFNPTEKEAVFVPDWGKTAGQGRKYLYVFRGQSAVTDEVCTVTVPPRSGKLFFASDRPFEKCPDNIWEW